MSPIERWGTIPQKEWENISQSNPVRGRKGGIRLPKDEITEAAQRAASLSKIGSPTEYKFSGDNPSSEAYIFANKVRRLGGGQLRAVKE